MTALLQARASPLSPDGPGRRSPRAEVDAPVQCGSHGPISRPAARPHRGRSGPQGTRTDRFLPPSYVSYLSYLSYRNGVI